FLGQVTGTDLGRVAALGKALHHDVAVGEDAVQPVVGTADRQRADTQIAHLLRRGRDAVTFADAFRPPVHDVPRLRRGMRLRVGVQGSERAVHRLVRALP